MPAAPRILQVRIQSDPPARLDKALARDVPAEAALSRSRIARLIAEGAVRRDGAVLDDPRARVAEGEVLDLTVIDDAEPDLMGEAIPLAVVYEDADLIVIDKPAGMVVHPASGARTGTLVNALIAHCGDSLSGIGGERRPGIVHRIDKDTSGLLVAAKTDRAHHGLARQFEAHDVERHYRALVHGLPDAGDPRLAGLAGVGFEPSGVIRIASQIGRHPTDRQRGTIDAPIDRHPYAREKMAVREGGRDAVTHWEVREVFNGRDGKPVA
ncbi:MAG: RNA pseudouridine synthase, partial [Mangrovicoccus sp.]|nr:RNA pseudouridine synthase [Mangrovicoccus sp.]